MPTSFVRPAILLCLGTAAFSTHAAGTRTLAMGGASVTAGVSAEGAFANPALLMREQRAGRKFGFSLGMGMELRDSGAILDGLDDNQDLAEDLEAEIDNIVEQALVCDISNPDQTQTCLTGTGKLGSLAGDLDKFLRDVDSEPLDLRMSLGLGAVWPAAPIPFGVQFSVKGTVSGLADVGDGDLAYTGDLSAALTDGNLSLQEITDYAAITLNTANGTIDIGAPDEELDSEVRSTVVLRAELALSLAHQLNIAGHDIDVGITPRISKLAASTVDEKVSGDSDANNDDDDFDANKNEENSFTVDVGALYEVPQKAGLTVGGVIRNLIPESIKTKTGFKVESKPQLILSALYQKEFYLLTVDAAINEGTYDNYETQAINFGAELNKSMFSLRGGVHADLAIDAPLAFTAGLGVGVFDLGLRVSESNVEFGLQIAY